MAKVKITLAELTVVVQAAVEVATDTRRGYRDELSRRGNSSRFVVLVATISVLAVVVVVFETVAIAIAVVVAVNITSCRSRNSKWR